MNKIFSAALIALGFSGQALAQDLGARPYTRAPVIGPSYNWSGFYAGLNAGYSSTSTDYSTTYGPEPGFAPEFSAPTYPIIAGLGSGRGSSKDGGTVGGQAGYNLQAQNIVYGIEADISYIGAKSSLDSGGQSALGSPLHLTSEILPSWLATFRGRIGYAFDRTLFFVTGGLALTEQRYEQTFHSRLGADAFNSINQIKTGWTAGGGIEHAIAGSNWTIKGEYLFARFDGDSSTSSTTIDLPNPGFKDRIGGGFGRQDIQVARLGVNYKLGWDAR